MKQVFHLQVFHCRYFINVFRRRGITLLFLNIIDSCEVKVKVSHYMFMQEKLLIILLHIKMLI